jgi:hypothetical protein
MTNPSKHLSAVHVLWQENAGHNPTVSTHLGVNRSWWGGGVQKVG